MRVCQWSEPNRSETKMKFELERTWDVKRRLNTWSNRAKAIQDILTANIFASKGDYISRLSTTLASKFITSQTATINQIVTWLDRINRTCVHQSDNIRTQISFAKMEKANINRGIGI